MVNLVVRHAPASHLQTTLPSKSVNLAARHSSPKTRERVVPSPIRIAYHNRPVSPLTHSESLFGVLQSEQVRPSTSLSSELKPNRSFESPVQQQQQRRQTVSPLQQQQQRRQTVSPLQQHQQLRQTVSPNASLDDGGELVCDYDQNVTQLYELLESSQWDKARLRCRTNPEEVQTWIVRRDLNANVRWKLLPLHAAVIFQAPTVVVASMLQEYPVAAGQRDDQGMLPLHLAFRHKQEESLLELLLQQYPGAVMIRDRRDRLPIDHGKECQFSARLMQMYSEISVKCAGVEKFARPVVDEEAIKASYEDRIKELQSLYEGRISDLMRDHDEELRNMKMAAEDENRAARKQHNQEMDELRDLLSREVTNGRRTEELEIEVQELRSSLDQSNQDVEVLRTALRGQTNYQEELKAHVHAILNDHKTLQSFCLQQQQDLEQAQQLRDDLLRSLVAQQEDGKAMQSALTITQMSEKIRKRTEKLLKKAPQAPTTPMEDPPLIMTGGDNDAHHEETMDAFVPPQTTRTDPSGWDSHHPPAEPEEDDISAITENSHF